MISTNDITHLTEMWNNRLSSYKSDSSDYSLGYRDALMECINDVLQLSYPLEQIVANIPPQEVEYYLESQEADNYLSTTEAHEVA